MKKVLSILLVALLLVSVSMTAFADSITVSQNTLSSSHKIKEVVYYDKNPDPNAEGEIANYPAVWMLYDDPDDHDNSEVFVLREVSSEEEAENKDFGYDGFLINGKWYKVIALWTVNPATDIIDKGEGEKAVFTPLYYGAADKPQTGDTVQVALYDYDSTGISNLVDVVIPEEGKETEVKVKETVTITVHYVYADGSQAAPDAIETCEAGFTNYLIESPVIEGYTPDRIAVTGLPSEDKEETVTYTKNADEPVIEPAPESKDISLDEASWTKGTGEDAEVVLKGTLKGSSWMVGDAYAKLSGPLSSEDCDAIWTGQKDVDTIITDNGNGTFSYVFRHTLYWMGDKLPTASSEMTLMMSFWKGGKEYVSNQLKVGFGKTAKRASGSASAFTVKPGKSKLYVGETTTIKVTGGSGKTTFSSKTPKIATVDKNGKVKAVSSGKATVIVDKNGVKKNVNITVVKKTNTMKVKGKIVNAKAKKKMKFKKSKAYSINNEQGTLSFKKVSGNSKVTVNKTTGTITVNKGLKKGKTYSIKVKVTAAGTKAYNSASETVTVKIKVK